MSTYSFKQMIKNAVLISIVITLICGRTSAASIAINGNRLCVDGKPYIIRGVTWSPATRAPEKGPNPKDPSEEVDYGFFFDWPGRDPLGHDIFNYWLRTQFLEYYKTDIPLMKDMNVNTVRVYADFGDDPAAYKKILDEFRDNGIMVIMTVVSSKEELDNERYLKVVGYCKDHPAILMWSLGNEWNMDFNKYYGFDKISDAAAATNVAARKIKKIDPNHPVSTCLGDRFEDKDPENTIANILKVCPDIDIWGMNIYRGASFYDLFKQWQGLTSKPVYISEFGTDSFRTTKCTEIDEFQAKNCEGSTDEEMQASFEIKLWKELTGYLSALNPAKPCLGGLVHEFNDELWKVGSYHMSLGDLVDYEGKGTKDYMEYNIDGFILKGGHPDGVANEEYFGVVTADRKPKKAYGRLRDYYKILKEKGDLVGKPRMCRAYGGFSALHQGNGEIAEYGDSFFDDERVKLAAGASFDLFARRLF